MVMKIVSERLVFPDGLAKIEGYPALKVVRV